MISALEWADLLVRYKLPCWSWPTRTINSAGFRSINCADHRPSSSSIYWRWSSTDRAYRPWLIYATNFVTLCPDFWLWNCNYAAFIGYINLYALYIECRTEDILGQHAEWVGLWNHIQLLCRYTLDRSIWNWASNSSELWMPFYSPWAQKLISIKVHIELGLSIYSRSSRTKWLWTMNWLAVINNFVIYRPWLWLSSKVPICSITSSIYGRSMDLARSERWPD